MQTLRYTPSIIRRSQGVGGFWADRTQLANLCFLLSKQNLLTVVLTHNLLTVESLDKSLNYNCAALANYQ